MDIRSGGMSRAWRRFFLSLFDSSESTQTNADLLVVAPAPTGGTVTSVDASGGSTGLTFTGGPITTSGTLTLGGTLDVDSGGTGQTSYTNGQLLIGNTTGNTLTPATLTAGTNVTIANGAGAITVNATDAFVGTVTSVSVVSANGFAGTVATATTTPAITLSTSITGVLKGNGTAVSAASAGTDYVAPGAYTASGLTMATSRLLGRTTASAGAAEEISIAGGLTLSGGVLTGLSGTITSVTGTAPVVSSGGSTPAISMAAATTSVNGYLKSTDWNTFNSKGSGSVTSVGSTGTVNGITLTGTVTTSGSLTLGGTLSGVNLTSQVTGTLPVANGGTGATTLTGYVKGAGTSVFTAAASVPAADVSGLATVATSGSFADLSNHPGVQSNGQAVLGGSHVISTSTIGTNILIVTSGITLTFPATGFASGEGVAVSNVSGGNVTLAIPGGADFGTTLPTNGTFLAFCDGGGFWRQYCYSTTRL
tara:strand:+ start:7674 stop:9110 length:1437 start_codon:yes stop_codon:yes gene_type:complete